MKTDKKIIVDVLYAFADYVDRNNDEINFLCHLKHFHYRYFKDSVLEEATDYIRAQRPTPYLNEDFYTSSNFINKQTWWKYTLRNREEINKIKSTFLRHIANKLQE